MKDLAERKYVCVGRAGGEGSWLASLADFSQAT